MGLNALDRIFAGAQFLLGVYIIVLSLDYGLIRGPDVPGAGFFPLLAGIALCVLSTINLVRSFLGLENYTELVSLEQVRSIIAVIVAIGCYLLMAPFIGMLLALPPLILAIGLGIQGRFEARMLVRLAVIAVLLPIACYFVFAWFLDVTIIKGPFGF